MFYRVVSTVRVLYLLPPSRIRCFVHKARALYFYVAFHGALCVCCVYQVQHKQAATATTNKTDNMAEEAGKKDVAAMMAVPGEVRTYAEPRSRSTSPPGDETLRNTRVCVLLHA